MVLMVVVGSTCGVVVVVGSTCGGVAGCCREYVWCCCWLL